MEFIRDHLNYWVFIVLLMIGLFAMISKKNLIKKLIGMSIFQAAIILFFVSTGVKDKAKIPIIIHGAHHEPGQPDNHAPTQPVNPDKYANPLPHVLMLTAIVVGVATLGVGLAVCQKTYHLYGTLEEDKIMEQLNDG